MKYKIKNANVCASGGGCYEFIGALSNNEYFLASNTCFDVRIISRNPNDYDYNEIWFPTWQEECLIKDLIDLKERKSFFENLFKYFKKNNPNDYVAYDMSWIEETLENYNE
jgi:hypothetical protein